MKVTIEVDDDTLRLVDGVAQRAGLDREQVIGQVVTEGTASRVLLDLFGPREGGLSEAEAADLVAEERRAWRDERRGESPPVS